MLTLQMRQWAVECWLPGARRSFDLDVAKASQMRALGGNARLRGKDGALAASGERDPV